MTDWMYLVDYFLAGALLIMMAIGIALSAFMPALDRWNKRYFIILFSMFFLCTLTCFLAVVFWGNPATTEAARINYLFEGLFISTPVFMPTLLLLR